MADNDRTPWIENGAFQTVITQLFGVWEEIIGARHSGIDISGAGIFGKNVTLPSIYSGATVQTAGWQNGYGNTVILRLQDGTHVLLGHLSKIMVKVGDTVNGGDVLGQIGSTGISTGAHLHFEVRPPDCDRSGCAIDPRSWLQAAGSTVGQITHDVSGGIPNPLSGLEQIARTVSKVDATFSDPAFWWRIGLLMVGTFLVVGGVLIYVFNRPETQQKVVQAAKAAAVAA